MTWSITELARMAGITARALRHYDEIGLLRPDRVGANGYRYYERAQLLRLQEILLMRELDLDLPTIAKVLDGEHDRLATLRAHHGRLLAERDRMDRLVHTVEASIAELEGGSAVEAEQLFDGFEFTAARIVELEAEFGEHGPAEFAELKANTANWTAEDFLAAQSEADLGERRLLALMLSGAPADDPKVLDLMAEDYAAQSRLVTPSRDSYVKLAQAFATAPQLRAHLDRKHPKLAEYMRDAMIAYAENRLT